MFDLASAHSYITLNHILLIAYKLLINFKRGGGVEIKKCYQEFTESVHWSAEVRLS